jgi:hypothetical protein
MVRSLRLKWTKPDLGFVTMKDETRLIICVECWRATDELVEFRGVEVNIIEELCQQPVESRGVDLGQKFLQVFIYTFERKPL